MAGEEGEEEGSLPLAAVLLPGAWWPSVWRWETGGRSLMAKGNWVSSWSSMDRLETWDRRHMVLQTRETSQIAKCKLA